jgi:NAD(P)-dependent dehydrogenase (short-subunit alcohol dehydrogenase family)
MLTGHLSKYLSGPPGPKLQQFNALLHTEPYSFIVYGIYWFFVLSIGAPLVAVSVVYLMLYEVLRHFVWKRRKIEPRGQTDRSLAVVVTGCDTGFGKEIVFRLVAEGFVVFAGCLKKESKQQYQGLPLVIPMVLDVTSDKQVAQAFTSAENWLNDPSAKKKRHLHALVNNAGMGKGGYVDWVNISDYQICMDGEYSTFDMLLLSTKMDHGRIYIYPHKYSHVVLLVLATTVVNCFSLVRMAKAFLPIFKRQAAEQTYGDARIMNVISMAGMLSASGLALNPYEVAKHAAEAFTDGLRLELKMFGVDVIAVNPSFHKTPLVADIRRQLEKDVWDQLNPKVKQEYGQGMSSTLMALSSRQLVLG